jgi:hypothetical protein
MLRKLLYGSLVACTALLLTVPGPALAHRRHHRHHDHEVHHRHARHYHYSPPVRHYHPHYRSGADVKVVLPFPLLPHHLLLFGPHYR